MVRQWILPFILLLANLSLCKAARACNMQGPSFDVLKGPSPAPKCRYPYLVSLRHRIWSTHECSGALIDSYSILTSGNCAELVKNGAAYINGYIRTGPFEENIPIASIILHPSYQAQKIQYNVAIVRLSEKSSQQTVSLPGKSNAPSKGDRVTLFGWGRIAPQGAFSGVVQANNKVEISPSSCTKQSDPFGVLCAGIQNEDLCEGDMGGPLIKQGNSASGDVLIGITSKVVGDCATQKGPGLFTDITTVSSWIQANTR